MKKLYLKIKHLLKRFFCKHIKLYYYTNNGRVFYANKRYYDDSLITYCPKCGKFSEVKND